MEPLKYKRSDILFKLNDNRAKHKDDYNNVMKVFKESVVSELQEALELAEAGVEYRLVLKQTKPVNYLDNYDRAIVMLEMSSQEEIQLTEKEFDQYVLDNWGWKHIFDGIVKNYA